MRIFLDIDDVIFNFNGDFAKRFNIKPHKHWSKSNLMKKRLDILTKEKDFWLSLSVKNYPNFQPNGFVSARGIPKSWTKESLKLNDIPGRSNVHQVYWGKSKVELLRNLEADIFIDDKYETFKECNQNGIFCLLMDAPHNKEYKTNLRVYNLDINTIIDKYNNYSK